tara:strand:- start:649 stop:1077 length:429 start_codon:yes stop_codon:yes gene_type:complete
MPAAELVHMATINVQVGPMIEVGKGHKGTRVTANVSSLTVTSERINASLATDDAADWLTVGDDGTGLLDVRFTLKTDDGAFIYVEYQGRADMSTGLIATAPTFQTGDERYAWLNNVQAVAAGQLNGETGELVYELYEVQVSA